jgi:hypothetical protein
VTNNSSWALKLLGVGAANGFNTPASGFTMRRQQYFCVFSDSNAGVSSQSAETVAGGVGETLGATVELVAGQAPPSDPAFANVQLLLRGEGANGGATFADSSLFNKPMTRTGSATTSTAQFKYGTSSLFFQNSGAIRMTSTSADPWISMGTGLYTVEFWAYVTTNGTMFDNGSITITGMFGALRVRYNSNSSNLIVSGTTLGATWTHIAVVQNAASTVLYINGVNSGSAGFIVGTNSVSFTPIGDSNFAGYIDEVRVTKGVARYTANFTPPAAEFPRL